MSLAYRFLYRVRFTPWEHMAKLPVTDQIDALFAREEEGHVPPYGEVLDLGCGSRDLGGEAGGAGVAGDGCGLRPQGPAPCA
jgi:hypothetical protein